MDMSNSLLQWVLGEVFLICYRLCTPARTSTGCTLPTLLHSPQPTGVQEEPVCYPLRRLGRSIASLVTAVMT
jgi:hypothetical protein